MWSGEEGGDGLGFDEFAGLVEVVVDDGVWGDAEGVVDGGEEFAWVDGVFEWGAAGFVGAAVDVAAFDACAGDDAGVAVRPVVAAVWAVVVAAGADAFLGTAAEFADGDDEGGFEEPALVEVVDESGETAVEHGGGLFLHAVEETGVAVP